MLHPSLDQVLGHDFCAIATADGITLPRYMHVAAAAAALVAAAAVVVLFFQVFRLPQLFYSTFVCFCCCTFKDLIILDIDTHTKPNVFLFLPACMYVLNYVSS